ncbi:MAG: hypothetical protein WHT08_01775 [Bryobacteraceae bacterium]|jgi:hypothetical protein
MGADTWSDFRNEVMCAKELAVRWTVMVLTNPAAPPGRGVTRTASREYRLWLARNLGAGYGSYFEWEEEP